MDFLLYHNAKTAIATYQPKLKSVWVKPKSKEWFDMVVPSWSDEEFRQNFRVRRSTFQLLADELKPFIQKEDTNMRKCVTVNMRLAVTLWRLGTNIEFRSIGHLFGIGKSTCVRIVREVTEAIVKHLLPKYIQIPSGNRLLKVISGFERRSGFPQVGGIVDGTHVSILAPKSNHTDYYSRHHCHTIILQAIVDDDYKFTNVCIGWPGKAHDARIFKNSKAFIKGEKNELFENVNRTISGFEVPVLLLGDPAYPLLPWVMKSYPGGGLSVEQNNYNYKLCSTRIIVENAFGRLKGRWRCLLKRLDSATTNVPTIIAACCVLHNICESNSDFMETVIEDQDALTISVPQNRSNNLQAQSVRDALCHYLNT